MLNHLIENMHGYNPHLGYKVVNKKIVKCKKDEEITFKQEKEVLKYISNGLKQLYVYANMDDLQDENYTRQDYRDRNKKFMVLHKEIFSLFTDSNVFYSLWD